MAVADIAYLPIDPNAGYPQRFRCRIGGILLDFTIRYNFEGDYYTATIRDQDGDVIVHGKPFVYGAALLDGITDPRLPDVQIVTADMAGVRTRAGQAEFMRDVFPWLMEPVIS